jgi:Pentapeptide repeats (8 copies)
MRGWRIYIDELRVAATLLHMRPAHRRPDFGSGNLRRERRNYFRSRCNNGWRYNLVMNSGMIRFLTVVALMCAAASSAMADCGDRPRPGVDWTGCTKSRLLLGGQDLQNANLQRADLSGTDFRKADLSGANMTEADLSRARLTEATLKPRHDRRWHTAAQRTTAGEVSCRR